MFHPIVWSWKEKHKMSCRVEFIKQVVFIVVNCSRALPVPVVIPFLSVDMTEQAKGRASMLSCIFPFLYKNLTVLMTSKYSLVHLCLQYIAQALSFLRLHFLTGMFSHLIFIFLKKHHLIFYQFGLI